jgi:hypothetical protein
MKKLFPILILLLASFTCLAPVVFNPLDTNVMSSGVAGQGVIREAAGINWLTTWTNDGSFMFPTSTGTNHTVIGGPGPPYVIRNDGSFFMGTNVSLDVNENTTRPTPFWVVSMTDSNEPNQVNAQINVINNESYSLAALLNMQANLQNPANPDFNWYIEATVNTNTDRLWGAHVEPSASYWRYSSNNVNIFNVDDAGAVTSARAVTVTNLNGSGGVTMTNTSMVRWFNTTGTTNAYAYLSNDTLRVDAQVVNLTNTLRIAPIGGTNDAFDILSTNVTLGQTRTTFSVSSTGTVVIISSNAFGVNNSTANAALTVKGIGFAEQYNQGGIVEIYGTNNSRRFSITEVTGANSYPELYGWGYGNKIGDEIFRVDSFIDQPANARLGYVNYHLDTWSNYFVMDVNGDNKPTMIKVPVTGGDLSIISGAHNQASLGTVGFPSYSFGAVNVNGQTNTGWYLFNAGSGSESPVLSIRSMPALAVYSKGLFGQNPGQPGLWISNKWVIGFTTNLPTAADPGHVRGPALFYVDDFTMGVTNSMIVVSNLTVGAGIVGTSNGLGGSIIVITNLQQPLPDTRGVVLSSFALSSATISNTANNPYTTNSALWVISTNTAAGGGPGSTNLVSPVWMSTNITLLGSGAGNSNYNIIHPLGYVPRIARCVLVCVTADAGLGCDVGTEIPVEQAANNAVSGQMAMTYWTKTNCWIVVQNSLVGNESKYNFIAPMNTGGGAGTASHPTSFNNFKFKLYAQ